YEALALPAHDSLAGAVRTHVAAQHAKLKKLIIGAEIATEDALPVLLYAPDRKAYGRLSLLITRGRRSAEKGACLLYFQDIADHAEGLLAVVVPRQVGMIENPTLAPDWQHIAAYRDLFGHRCYLAA